MRKTRTDAPAWGSGRSGVRRAESPLQDARPCWLSWLRSSPLRARPDNVLPPPVTQAGAQPTPAPTPAAGPIRLSEEVVVQAVRAEERTPVTKTDVARDAIEPVNHGQEMPFLLGTTPAVNFQSDSGHSPPATPTSTCAGSTRPGSTSPSTACRCSDPEDQALYFANFGDFASVVDSIQVQRGVGHLERRLRLVRRLGQLRERRRSADEPRLEAEGGVGSWGTRARHARGLGPGRAGLRALRPLLGQTSDGFRDHSGVDQHTLFFGATRAGARSLFKLFGFSGRERPQLAFLATDEATLATRPALQRPHPRGDATTSARTSCRRSTRWPRGRLDDAGGAGLLQRRPGLVPHLGRGPREPAAVRPRRTLRRPRARRDPPPRAALGLNWGAHVNDFTRDHFLDVVGGARAYDEHGAQERGQHASRSSTWDRGPLAALRRRAGALRALRVPRATSRSAR